MVEFKLSNNIQLIKEVLLSSNNIEYSFDDAHQEYIKDFEPLIHKNIYYIEVSEDNDFKGFFFIVRKNELIGEAHLAFLPKAYGKVSKYGKLCLDWVWKNLDFSVLICPCIEENKLALNCIKKMGFQEYGYLLNAWIKNKKSSNFILLIKTKYDEVND